VSVRYVAEVDNIDTIKRFVEIGQGVAIVPEPAVQTEVRSETLSVVHINDDRMLRPLALVHRKGKQLSPAAEKFVEYLTSKKREMEGGAVEGRSR
jgi:DNA-binding transcriptional LysR family regulator